MSESTAKKSLRTDVRDRLRRDIIEGVFRPGQILRDLELAAQYGVSTSPVREAIADIASERLVEIPVNGVKRVAPLDRKTSLDFYEIFRMLSLRGYEVGAPKIGPSGLLQMRAVLEGHHGDGGGSMSLFREFHDPVFIACGNRELRRLLGVSGPWLERLVYLLPGRKGPRSDAVDRSLAIVEALEGGDSARAIHLFTASVDALGREIEEMPDVY